MRILTATVLIIVLGLLAHLFLPWWIIAPVVLIISLAFNKSTGEALLSGFFGVFLLWLGAAIFQTLGNQGILVERMGNLLPVSGVLLYLLTAFIGGLIGLFSSLTGYFIKTVKQ